MTATNTIPIAPEAQSNGHATADWAIIPCHSPVDGWCSCGKPKCHSPAKHPRTLHGLSDASTDPLQQAAWWRKWPNANLAIVTGPSGLVVVDVDADKGGFESLREIEEQHGHFPDTVTARTGSGGLHYYFRAPAGDPISSQNGWRPGIDIKAEGGYVIAPPSRNLKGAYTWEPGCAPSEIEVAEIPDWLLPLLPRKDKPRESPPPAPTNGHASLLQRAQQYAAKANGASEGTRNSEAYNLAGNVRAIEDEYGCRLDESQIVDVLAGWNARCNPPLDESELRTVVHKALTTGVPRDPKPPRIESPRFSTPPPEPLQRFTVRELRKAHPRLHPPVVEPLFRKGETCNIIADPKRGKSWLLYSLLLSVITGRKWLSKFTTSQGRVLLVDNELHPCTIAHRIATVATAMGITEGEYEDDFVVAALRGNLRSMADLEAELSDGGPGEFKVIAFDAKYRFAIPGQSENDNASEALFYNLVDRIGGHTEAACVLIHHATKGSQSDKKVTDVGAGGGAQARAADCHVVLRQHEEPDVIVLDAAVRSFPPIEPVALRWRFPVWQLEDAVDPKLLKGRGSVDERQAEKDREGLYATIKALRAGPETARNLRRKTGFGEYRQGRLLDLLISQGAAAINEKKVGGKTYHVFALSE